MNFVPKRLDPNAETVRLQLVTTAAWVRLVDDWRRRQPDIPNRSDAIRRLVDAGIKEKEKPRRS